MSKSFSLNLKLSIRNGHLLTAAKSVGGQSKLAKLLGIHVAKLSDWCNLRSCPPKNPNRFWSQESLNKIESKLLELTGLLLEDIFPDELRARIASGGSVNTFERQLDIDKTLIEYMGDNSNRFILPDPSEVAATLEASQVIKDNIATALASLSYREREVLKLRRGLSDGTFWTLEDVACVFKVTREKVRQLESKAMYKLRSSPLMYKSLLIQESN